MEQVKSADYKSGYQCQDRCTEKKEQQPKQISCFGSLRQKIVTQADERDSNGDQGNQTNETIKHDGEQCARFFVRRFLEQVIAFHDIAAGASRKKLVVKHADTEQTREARKTQMDFLDFQQNVPAKSRGDFHHYVSQDA